MLLDGVFGLLQLYFFLGDVFFLLFNVGPRVVALLLREKVVLLKGSVGLLQLVSLLNSLLELVLKIFNFVAVGLDVTLVF